MFCSIQATSRMTAGRQLLPIHKPYHSNSRPYVRKEFTQPLEPRVVFQLAAADRICSRHSANSLPNGGSSPVTSLRKSSAGSGNSLHTWESFKRCIKRPGYWGGCSQGRSSFNASENASCEATHNLPRCSETAGVLRSGCCGQIARKYGRTRLHQNSARCPPAASRASTKTSAAWHKPSSGSAPVAVASS